MKAGREKRVRLIALVLVGIAAAGGLVLLVSPRLRSWLVSLGRNPSGPGLLLVSYAHLGGNARIEVFVNGRPVVLSTPWKVEGPGVLLDALGVMRFGLSVFKDDQLAYHAGYDANVRPGDMLRFYLEPADKEPTGRYGPPPSGSVPALIQGVPAKAWCWFGRSDNYHPHRLNVAIRPPEKSPSVRGRARRLGYGFVAERSDSDGKMSYLTLLRPWDKTMLQAMLEVQDWEGVVSAGPEFSRVY